MRLEEISFQTPENGYSPREDSWLLAKNIPKVKKKKCLDMGCGSGIQTAALLLQGAKEVTCADINADALAKTKEMVSRFFPKARIAAVESNLFQKIREKFDVIVFNPPYVPTESPRWRDTDGGKDGREVIDLFLKQFPSRLATGGTCFLLQSTLNNAQKTEQKMKKMGFDTRIIAEQKLDFETLQVVMANAQRQGQSAETG